MMKLIFVSLTFALLLTACDGGRHDVQNKAVVKAEGENTSTKGSEVKLRIKLLSGEMIEHPIVGFHGARFADLKKTSYAAYSHKSNIVMSEAEEGIVIDITAQNIHGLTAKISAIKIEKFIENTCSILDVDCSWSASTKKEPITKSLERSLNIEYNASPISLGGYEISVIRSN